MESQIEKADTETVEMSQVERKHVLSYRRENGKKKKKKSESEYYYFLNRFLEAVLILTLEMSQALLLYKKKDIIITPVIIGCKSSCFCLLLNPLLMSHF